MSDKSPTISPEAQAIVSKLQALFADHQLPEIHAAMVCVYTQMVFMCARTPREAKVLVNRMAEDMKRAVVDNMPAQKPIKKSAIIIPETSGKAN